MTINRKHLCAALPLLCACHGKDPAPEVQPELISEVSQKLTGGGGFGSSISANSDLDQDGDVDLMIGAPTTGDHYLGAVYIYCGPLSPPSTPAGPCGTIEGVETFTLGTTLSSTFDLDGDGAAELAVSDGLNYPDSRTFLLSPPLTGPSGEPLTTDDSDAVISTTDRETAPYTQLASLLDADGDGYGALVVSQPRYTRGIGTVFIADGPLVGDVAISGLEDRVDTTRNSDLGWSTANVGDANGDGLDDLLLGADGDSADTFAAGSAWLFHGPVLGAWVEVDADLGVRGTRGGQQLGWSVSGAGDVDGDGYADMWITTLQEADSPPEALLYSGAMSGDVHETDAVARLQFDEALGEGVGSGWGTSVAGVGDMDGDASPEALLGLPTDDESGDSAGAVWLVSGPFEGKHDLSVKGTKLVGESEGDMLGFVVAHGGDQSGDGLDDPVIQAWGYDDYAGALYVLDGLVR